MVRGYRSDDSYIWTSYRYEKIHFSWMIDAIFEDEISWVRSKKSDNCLEKYIYPKEGILSSGFCSDDGEWESKFTIIVVWRDHHILTSELVREIGRDMCRDRRLPDSPSHTDDIWFLDTDDQTSKECEK
jgi:hypothetical protein